VTYAQIFITPRKGKPFVDIFKKAAAAADTRLLNRHPNTTTTNRIPASFEQTQRDPTGHPDVCLCDVSGATN